MAEEGARASEMHLKLARLKQADRKKQQCSGNGTLHLSSNSHRLGPQCLMYTHKNT